MALPPAAPERQLKHSRHIDVQIYARGAGLWEVDAFITDVKTRDTQLTDRVRRAGEPIHDMLLRLVIDEAFNILEAGSETRAMPYPGECDDHGDAYRALVGLNLMKGFRFAVAERLGGVAGCTHLTELTQVLPTAVVQAFAGDVINTRGEGVDAKQPFQLDRCHALRTDGNAVRLYYPRWFKPAPEESQPPSTVPRTLSEESPR
ncbi:MAG TPA: DUF2889 domain-containing protein [Rhizobacter sp.]|nr:DUF2889 domain-containing protein [Rhizobacter sp.]